MVKASYTIEYAEGVADDLAILRAFERRLVLDRIDEHLTREPTRQTRSKKMLFGLIPPWEHVDPVWELRAGQFRVFYDVRDTDGVVTIRAVRRKPPHKTTEEIV